MKEKREFFSESIKPLFCSLSISCELNSEGKMKKKSCNDKEIFSCKLMMSCQIEWELEAVSGFYNVYETSYTRPFNISWNSWISYFFLQHHISRSWERKLDGSVECWIENKGDSFSNTWGSWISHNINSIACKPRASGIKKKPIILMENGEHQRRKIVFLFMCSVLSFHFLTEITFLSSSYAFNYWGGKMNEKNGGYFDLHLMKWKYISQQYSFHSHLLT